MRLQELEVLPSPQRPGFVRLAGTIAYESKPRKTETWWLEVAEAQAGDLSLSGSPWLAAMLPIASVRGERIRLDRPVDPRLLAGAPEVMASWRRWYGYPRVVEIEADVDALDAPPRRRAAAFFSRGIDSFFTLLSLGQARLEELLLVQGFEREIVASAGWEDVARATDAAAGELGVPVLHVATNLRRTRWRKASFTHIAHGCLLGFVALCLELRYREVHIASSVHGPPVPWGSHPHTDPLLSTSALSIRCHGEHSERFSKSQRVAASPTARAWLRVCSSSADGGNCGRCRKCLLAMAMLEVAVGLGSCRAFAGHRLSLDAIRRLALVDSWDRATAGRAAEAARSTGRRDLADALEHALAHSGAP